MATQPSGKARVCNTLTISSILIVASIADVAKQADARDLKSLGANTPCRFKSGHQHQKGQVEIPIFFYFYYRHFTLFRISKTVPCDVRYTGRLVRFYAHYSIISLLTSPAIRTKKRQENPIFFYFILNLDLYFKVFYIIKN